MQAVSTHGTVNQSMVERQLKYLSVNVWSVSIAVTTINHDC